MRAFVVRRAYQPRSQLNRGFSSAADWKKTLVYDEHVADGGKMVDFAGYGMPVQYTKQGGKHSLSIIDSTKWTRESASLFDVSHMCSIRWTGENAMDFVESVTTADVRGLKLNTGTLSVITNEEGGIIDDTMVSRVVNKEHGEHVYQVVNAGCAIKDLEHFEQKLKNFNGKVNMTVLWDERGLYALQGPKAASVLSRFAPTLDLTKMNFGETEFVNIEGAECIVTRCGYTGEDGFEIFAPKSAAVSLWQQLRDTEEVRLAALGARDALRLEAGLCLYGHDIDDKTTPSEAGLSWVVGKARRDPNSIPFPGSDKILAQIADPKTQVKKLRAGLMPLSGPPAREGAAIETKDGVRVGTITSGTMSPILRKNIAIGYIDKPYNKKDTELNVVVRGKKYPAVTTKMPFVPTKYYKP